MKNKPSSLDKEIEKGRQEIRTDGYPMSFGEIASMYEKDEIDIHPEFQRFFRWTPEQKSRLIESILLGIPLPSIFVAQQMDGTWDVVDGLQRLSTIFQLMGILRNHEGKLHPPLALTETKYLPSLEGVTWSGGGGKVLSETQKLLIKRSKIDIKIIQRESSRNTKYELFQRLNSGGSPLSRQELRNCLLVMINSEFFDWMNSLANDINFLNTISLSENSEESQFGLELVTRFLIFRKMPKSSLGSFRDLGDFLDDSIVELASSKTFNFAKEEKAFRDTFEFLANVFPKEPENVFHRYNSQKKKFMGGFLISAFEAVALGTGYNISEPKKSTKLKLDEFAKKVQGLWSNKTFRDNTGSGANAKNRMPIIVDLGRGLFKP